MGGRPGLVRTSPPSPGVGGGPRGARRPRPGVAPPPGPGLGALQAHSWPGGPSSFPAWGPAPPSPLTPYCWTMDAGGRRHPRPRARARLRSPPLPSRTASCASTSLTLWAGRTQHRLDPLGISWTHSAPVGQRCSLSGREVRTGEMRPRGPRTLLLLLLLLFVAGPAQLSAQVSA